MSNCTLSLRPIIPTITIKLFQPTTSAKQNQNASCKLAMKRITLLPKIPTNQITRCRLAIPMAEEKPPNVNLSVNDPLEKEKEKENATIVEKKLPEPPEKPLPDDCCGSGCVRCVWDIYYDELEDYNKLVADMKDVSDSKSN